MASSTPSSRPARTREERDMRTVVKNPIAEIADAVENWFKS
jgi:hypothetical protein